MPLKRFFLLEIPEREAFIEDKELHHMRNVLRLEEGEEIELFDGKGNLATAVLTKYHKQKCQLRILSLQNHIKKPYNVSLLQGLTKANRLDWLLEKVVEIGLDEVFLYPSDRSLRNEYLNLDRLENLMISACKQSGELFLPKLDLLLQSDLASLSSYELVFLDPRATTPLKEVVSKFTPNQKILLCIGPESGWSPEEEAWEQTYKLRVQRALLFGNVLRSETAALCSLAITRHLH